MPDILHRIGVKDATPEAAYRAVATAEGVAAWWSTHAEGGATEGSELHFYWDDKNAGMRAKVVELRPNEHVEWEFVDAPAEWLGTHISFDIKRDGDYTIILFTHAGWAEPIEFMHHCSTKWGVFMMSLKSLVETGQGRREPQDLATDNW